MAGSADELAHGTWKGSLEVGGHSEEVSYVVRPTDPGPHITMFTERRRFTFEEIQLDGGGLRFRFSLATGETTIVYACLLKRGPDDRFRGTCSNGDWEEVKLVMIPPQPESPGPAPQE